MPERAPIKSRAPGQVRAPDDAISVSANAAKASHRNTIGVALDIGAPDGINLDLVLSPAAWLRLAAALGTNTAGYGYRGGVSFVPVGWGPSFTFEAGRCSLSPTNQVVRSVFKSPSWAKPYVQELGYTYFNAHVGFDYVWGNTTIFLHGGYTYLVGTVRGAEPVIVDKTTQTTALIADDGKIYAHTLSAKLGFVYMFGGF